MTKLMTPSDERITQGQIGKICDGLAARLRRRSYPKEVVQRLIAHNANALYSSLEQVVQSHTNALDPCRQIVREVTVQSGRTSYEAFVASRLDAFSDFNKKTWERHKIANTIQRTVSGKVTVVFFQIETEFVPRYPLKQIMHEYRVRNLVPADPFAVFAINEDDPTFAKGCKHQTFWQVDCNWVALLVHSGMSCFINTSGETHWVLDPNKLPADSWFAGVPIAE